MREKFYAEVVLNRGLILPRFVFYYLNRRDRLYLPSSICKVPSDIELAELAVELPSDTELGLVLPEALMPEKRIAHVSVDTLWDLAGVVARWLVRFEASEDEAVRLADYTIQTVRRQVAA